MPAITNRACLCVSAFRRERSPSDENFVAVVATGVRIFTPGCPVHEPPGEDDYHSFETPKGAPARSGDEQYEFALEQYMAFVAAPSARC